MVNFITAQYSAKVCACALDTRTYELLNEYNCETSKIIVDRYSLWKVNSIRQIAGMTCFLPPCFRRGVQYNYWLDSSDDQLMDCSLCNAMTSFTNICFLCWYFNSPFNHWTDVCCRIFINRLLSTKIYHKLIRTMRFYLKYISLNWTRKPFNVNLSWLPS